MAWDPITGITNLIEKGLDKFVADKMSEADKEELKFKLKAFMVQSAITEDKNFRDFVLDFEGRAKDIPKTLVWLRSAIRPAFTILIGYTDYLYFKPGVTFTDEQSALLYAVNIIVLGFWFGEKALQRSGIIEIIKSRGGK